MKKKIDLDRNYWVDAGGNKYEFTEMKNSHLINTVLYLRREVGRIKAQCDLALLDDTKVLDSVKRLYVLLSGEVKTDEELIKSIWELDDTEWLGGTTTYQGLLAEIENRDLMKYLISLVTREQKRNEK